MSLLDQHGRKMTVPAKKDLTEEIAGPTLGSVRQITSAHPADGLTPHRLGVLLKEAETGDATAYLELAEQMEEKDLHYAGVLGVRKRAIRRLNLVVEAGADDQASEDAAALVRQILGRPAVKDDFVDMLDALGKGYSVTEMIWDVRKAPWTIAEMKHRDPRWFRFDHTDGQKLLLRDNEGDLPLKPFRFIDHRARLKSGLPIRSGLARLVAWAYVFKNYTLKDWAIFLEAYGHPLRIGKHGPQATVEERATLLRAVKRLGVDMAAIMPKSMEVEIVNGAVTNGDKMFESSARFWDEQISKAVLGQVSTTDAIAGGHAVGKVHNEVRDDIRDADAEQLAGTLQRDLAAPVTMLNFAGRAKCPSIRFEAEEERDPRLTLVAIKTLGPLGLQVSQRQAREVFGLREPEEGEDLLTFKAPAKAPSSEDANSDTVTAAQLIAASRLPGATADRLIEDGRAQTQMDVMLGGMLEAIGQARTLEEVRDILGEVADEAPDETLRELLARLTFNARLAGEAGLG